MKFEIGFFLSQIGCRKMMVLICHLRILESRDDDKRMQKSRLLKIDRKLDIYLI